MSYKQYLNNTDKMIIPVRQQDLLEIKKHINKVETTERINIDTIRERYKECNPYLTDEVINLYVEYDRLKSMHIIDSTVIINSEYELGFASIKVYFMYEYKYTKGSDMDYIKRPYCRLDITYSNNSRDCKIVYKEDMINNEIEIEDRVVLTSNNYKECEK